MTRRPVVPALVGLALAVLLLHGWLIDGLAAATVHAVPGKQGIAARPVQAVALRAAPPLDADPLAAAVEPTAAGATQPPAAEPAQVTAAEPAVAPAAAAAGDATRPLPPPPRQRVARPRPAASVPDRSPAAVAVAVAVAPAEPVEAALPAPATMTAVEPLPEAVPADGAAAPAVLLAAAAPAATAGGDAGTPPPVYKTRLPPPARLAYRLSRGGLVGVGELDWQPQARAYTLRLEGKLPPLGTLIVQTSRGGFDAAGLAPDRYTDKRLRRGEQAANFQRDAGRISFSGPDTELPLLPGVQDRLSVMLQLAAIANAWSRPPAVGTELRIQVVGARGDAHLWTLRYDGPQAVQTAAGAVPALRFSREPAGPYDTRAEFWLDGARSYLPVRVRLTDGRGETLELLRDAPVP